MSVPELPGGLTGNEPEQASPKHRAGALSRLLHNPLGLISLIVLVILILLALFTPLLTHHSPIYASLNHVNAPVGTPDWPLGGDQYGRDIWSRVLTSIQVSLISAVIGASVGIVVGAVFGLIAGYVGRHTDAIASWVFNLLMTFPALVLVMLLYPVMGSTYQGMMLIFGLFLAPGIFRLVRNLVQAVRNELYVDAARVSGLSNWRILSRHVLYVVRGPIVISGVFLASSAIGVQAGLAFLGFGSTQTPSFGSMTNDAFANIYTAPLQIVWPALFLALLNASLILLGNAYRDALAAPQSKARKPAVPDEQAETETVATPANKTQGGLLSVRNLRVSYPMPDGGRKLVVSGLSLDVSAGEIVGLVGESGSGKTQTAFSILGLLPKEAQISADCLSLAGDPLIGKGAGLMRKLRQGVMSYVPQEPMANLDPAFTIGSQLKESLRKTVSRREAHYMIVSLLERVGIPDPEAMMKQYPHQISGGMAQRVLIAAAVMSRPKLLIADEPTTALDVTLQAEILDLLRELQGELGMGVLLVTHNFGVVADLCDRVVVMKEGELIEEGPVREIFHHPAMDYTKELVSAILDEETVRPDPPAVVSSSRQEGFW
ncbi:MAG: dipeptide/oligopeptide/nickel ABC transporter permease/ATP-binding protein [Propionibacteriaceae bacterium]|jgi:peptide/nickel transport system permease protein|nr:dipeptide/oligopeptide/nickel ABC transporter permease/ATP-binding protein [Propionibacteriaceae bacterium]